MIQIKYWRWICGDDVQGEPRTQGKYANIKWREGTITKAIKGVICLHGVRVIMVLIICKDSEITGVWGQHIW